MLVLLSLAASYSAADNCTSDGFDGSHTTILCIGTCDSGSCSPQDGDWDRDGTADYKYCGCPNKGEPACCHLILWTNTTPHQPDTRGDCPSCPLTGGCARIGQGVNAQAACVNPEPPPDG